MSTTKSLVLEKDSGTQCSIDIDPLPIRPFKFWEINHSFICPVIGMCLTFSEQKQILKKSGVSIKNKDPFEIHEILVSSSESDNRLSRKVDNLLNRKYGRETVHLLELSPEKFQAYFKTAFRLGDCLGVLWASAIHPQLPANIKKAIFGDIHMSMHWSGEESIKLKKMIDTQQKEIRVLQKRNGDLTDLRRSLQKEKKRNCMEKEELKISLAAARKEISRMETLLATLSINNTSSNVEQENRKLKDSLDSVMKDVEKKKFQITKLKKMTLRLSSELKLQRGEYKLFRQETQDVIGEFLELNRCDTTCPSYDLCQKRILIVGGMTRMESLYRELIEGSGGIFEYHDGYMKKGIKGLEGRLKRADVVVCPVNCNSHAACSIVKNLAKKHNKTVHMLASSSLNAVSQAIWGSSDRGTIN